MATKKITPDETKEHILRAGRELLLAAEGALSFCKEYVEGSNKEPRNPELAQFFTKALSVAEELGREFKKPLKKPLKNPRGRHVAKRDKND